MPRLKPCPTCKRNNTVDSIFCIYCGGKLFFKEDLSDPTPSIQNSSEPSSRHSQSDPEITQIRSGLASLADRITALEIAVSGKGSETPNELQFLQNRTGESFGTHEDSPQGKDLIPSGTFVDWKRLLAGNWLALIGAISLVTGIGFFLKLAFDYSWIGPTGQVSIGIILGIILLGLGEYGARKYPFWAQAVTGGGIAILYLSIYAAFSQFSLSLTPNVRLGCAF